MEPWIFVVIGLAAGLGGALLVSYFMRRNLAHGIQRSFEAISFQTLSKQQEMGGQELTGKKELIDQALVQMKAELEKVQAEMKEQRTQRETQHGELKAGIRGAVEQTARLQETTSQLNAALSSTQVRGQWGERMAEDVLRLAGFVEGINYLKQQTLEGAGTRPDFTFLLPQGQRVHMDVKFPLDHYLKYVNAEADTDRETHKAQFLRDVRAMVKQVTGREYINPEGNTLDYVIIFIPNEQVYAFIYAQDHDLMEDALRQHVILCSPVTLFAVLAVIRQALDNFRLETTASEMLSLLGTFNKQWKMFSESMDKMGRRLDESQKEYQQLVTRRRTALERPLRQIDELRLKQGIAEAELPESTLAELPPLTPEDEYDAA
jgi:DNA recombination protein RmuC